MKPDIVVVGTSLGGLAALEELLGGLPTSFPAPVVVVQHRSIHSGSGMRSTLQRHTAMRVREPDDKEAILAGRIYIAPPDYHLLVERGHFSLSIDAPVMYARPSINVLFESAAEAYGPGVVAVVLTGASADGAKGAACVKRFGGRVLVQDPDTAECAVMPRAARQAAQPDWVLPVAAIAPFLERLCAPDLHRVGVPGPDGISRPDGKDGASRLDGKDGAARPEGKAARGITPPRAQPAESESAATPDGE